MGQQLSNTHHPSCHHIEITRLNYHSNPTPIHNHIPTQIHQFPLSKTKPTKPTNAKKPKKHRIFDPYLPFTLPLQSNFKNPTPSFPHPISQNLNTNLQKYDQKNYFSQNIMKKSFFVYENHQNRRISKMQMPKRQSDQNTNPNSKFSSLEKKNSAKNKLRNTMKTLMNNQTKKEPINKSQSSKIFKDQLRINKNRQNMEDSIINQWFQISHREKRILSQGIMKRRQSKTKKYRVQKASGIFSKSLSRAVNNKLVSNQQIQLEENVLINITNVGLLQSRD